MGVVRLALPHSPDLQQQPQWPIFRFQFSTSVLFLFFAIINISSFFLKIELWQNLLHDAYSTHQTNAGHLRLNHYPLL